jgi:hypothetical protein
VTGTVARHRGDRDADDPVDRPGFLDAPLPGGGDRADRASASPAAVRSLVELRTARAELLSLERDPGNVPPFDQL